EETQVRSLRYLQKEDLRIRILNQARIYLGWSSCRVADHVQILQCYRCLSFGHIAKDCRAAA
ncbi:hypothetical protein EAG_01181, partial [Camponotus floridanus]